MTVEVTKDPANSNNLNVKLTNDLLQVQIKTYLQRVALVKTLCLILGIVSVISIIISTFELIFGPSSDSSTIAFYTIELVAGILFFGWYFLLSGDPQKIKPFRLNSIAWLMVAIIFVLIAVAQFFQSSIDGILAAYFLIPIAVILLGLGRKSIIAVSGIGLIALVITYVLKSQSLNIFSFPDLIDWAMIYILAAGGMIFFSLRLDQSLDLAGNQSEQLQNLLQALNSSTNAGATLSFQLSSVTRELNVTSRQQATSTQEQVAAVTQVTASLEELSETATQIAYSANQAAQSASRTVDTANLVKASREESLTVAEEGNSAVFQTVESVSQVRTRIELLGQRLLNLTEQTRRVGSIIDLIDEIADETHLLALNASIEAAGGVTSETTTSTSTSRANRGERFGVIAQEIKNLADRSRESTEEVRQAIQEMQGAVAAAVLVAEEGKKATNEASLRSQIAGAVINRLNSVIDNSSSRFEEILGAAEEVQQRCDEISIATGQQRTANQQILGTMRGVAQIARENADVVSELFNTASRASEQVEELTTVLVNASSTSDSLTGADKSGSGSRMQLQAS